MRNLLKRDACPVLRRRVVDADSGSRPSGYPVLRRLIFG
jgi:hypothetical protein